jgi:hypothetical protein
MIRHVLKALPFVTVLVVVLSAAPAYADGFVSPWIGANFANEVGDGRRALGVTAGSMGGGVIGGEFDFGYSPSFFGTENVFGSNNVLTLMGNVIIGIPIGGQRGVGVRPYGSGGVGMIRSSVEGLLGLADFTDNSFGYNLGGGIMGYFADHVGIRGDLRYFRTIHINDLTPNNFDLDLGGFNFWRASFGVVFR